MDPDPFIHVRLPDTPFKSWVSSLGVFNFKGWVKKRGPKRELHLGSGFIVSQDRKIDRLFSEFKD